MFQVLIDYRPCPFLSLQACSSIYFTLDSLHQIHFLYQYSLHFFLDVFTDVLNNNPNIRDHTDYSRRLSIIFNDLFQVC